MRRTWILESTAKAARLLRRGCGFALCFTAFSSVAWALPGAPEIDPGSAASSLALLAGGVMLVYDRYSRR